ncbi:MAG: HRDC domain-containing protein [Deltaproteobacteria bacterium]|nr:HRDC domain-containing protein [Deltaproteobacteria bacterium]
MVEPLPALVTEADEVAAITAAITAAGTMAIDLEFVSQDRFRPDLALVQVGWCPDGDPSQVEVRLLDPTAADVGPVIALCGGAVEVIAHAPRQDLQILGTRYGLRARRVFDTQTAAAFANLGDQVGYARLVEALLGLRLGKEAQWTDWLRRPLAPDQLRYADADVRHLPALAHALRRSLAALGRAAWVVDECDAIAEVAHRAATLATEEAWREVAGARQLELSGRAAARRLAAWRIETAAQINQPVSWLLGDRALIDLARARPRDERGLKNIKLPEAARRHVDALLGVIAQAADDGPEGLEVAVVTVAGGPRAQVWEEVIVALVQAASEDSGIPARYLATRGDAADVARALDARTDRAWDQVAHPLFTGWRREVVGGAILAWMSGQAMLAADPSATSGVRLRPQ